MHKSGFSGFPKNGPCFFLLQIAILPGANTNLWLLDNEKMNDSFRESKISSFELPQGNGVYPPITFPCSVSHTVKVLKTPSHDWWNHPISKLYSEAMKRSLALLIGLLEKNLRIFISSYFVFMIFEVYRNCKGDVTAYLKFSKK